MKLVGLTTISFGLVLSVFEWLHDFKINGWSWATVLSVALLLERIHHNGQTRDMLKQIGDEVGVKWKNGLVPGSNFTDLPNLRQLWRIFWKATKKQKLYYPRRKTKMSYLTNSISKKLSALIIGSAITALNNRFNLQIDPNNVMVLWFGVIAYIVGQSHVDAKKAISASVNAVATSVSQSIQPIGIQPTEAPPMTYDELKPIMLTVNTALNKFNDDLRSGKMTDTTRDAINAYVAINDYLTKKGA